MKRIFQIVGDQMDAAGLHFDDIAGAGARHALALV